MIGWRDGNGILYMGEDDKDIIKALRGMEWGDCPPVLEWKERVRMRAKWCGFDLEFYDAPSFLQALERSGLGSRVVLNEDSQLSKKMRKITKE